MDRIAIAYVVEIALIVGVIFSNPILNAIAAASFYFVIPSRRIATHDLYLRGLLGEVVEILNLIALKLL